MDRTPPLRRTLDPLWILRELWREREVAAQLARHDVQATYRGSLLGALWILIQPLLSLAVYAFVFTVVFQPRAAVQEGGRFEFVLSLFAGMVIYNLFAEVVSRSPLLVVTKTSYVKNVVFPLQVLPLSALGTALVGFACGLVILLGAVLASRGALDAAVLWLPVALLPLLFLTLGVSWLLASLGVYLRDVQPAVRVVLQLLFFATPIVYGVEALPPEWQRVVWLNPLAAIVTNARAGLLHGAAPSWPSWAATLAFGLAVFGVGYTWFARTRKGFADVM
ncbi:MAG: ABC transporter permease [Planctomycetes bacterium]|nr:ABC transporter permease [Planctomycetota bacterium]